MTADATIRVRVLHREPLSRAGLIAALRAQADVEMCEDVSDTPENANEDVVVADWHSAMALATSARERRGPASAIVVVFGADREWELRRALACNIDGYLTTGFSPTELADGIRAVNRGSRYLCARAAARLADSVGSETLTEREADVLQLVVEGLCNKSIARRLDIAIGTVKSHLKAAYEKLAVTSRTHAVAVAERRGLLSRPVGGEGGDAFDAGRRHARPRLAANRRFSNPSTGAAPVARQ
jgi:DNA-binding NarL/FixJ family response regulator